MASVFKSSLRVASALPSARLVARPTSVSLKPPSIACKQPLIQPRVAAFHSSKSLAILPAGPQVIDGTINDPAPVPEANPAHGSYHWSFERLISLALVPLTVAPFAAGSIHPITDAALGATIVIHSHIGFDSILVDYIPKRKHPTAAKAFRWGLKGATLMVLYGLYEFETNDVGVTEAVKRVWKA